MKYQCKECERIIDIAKKRAKEVVRKRHACENCNDITSFERLDHDINELTDAQREFFRSFHQKVRVNTRNSTQKTIHIDGGIDTLCNHNIDTRKVDISTYPLGYLDWCEHCLKRSKNQQKEFDCASDEESVKKALQYANEKADGEITRREYSEMEITPSVWTIQKVFDTWAKAKEKSL